MADHIHPWFKRMGREREAVLYIFIGEPGTGKSTMAQNFLSINARNLIVPSNMIEAPRTWNNLPALKPHRSFVPDPRDPKGKKQKGDYQK